MIAGDVDAGNARKSAGCPLEPAEADADVSGKNDDIRLRWRRLETAELKMEVAEDAKPHVTDSPLLPDELAGARTPVQPRRWASRQS
jgi:hypothetical protein